MIVNLFYRKSFKFGNFSIEKVFDTLLPNLKKNIIMEKIILPYYTKGFKNRLLNLLFTYINQGDVNHITGDVHYICLLCNKKNTILTIHDLIIIRNNKGFKKFLYYWFWYYFPLKHCKYVTVISSQIKNELISFFPWSENKIYVIYNPLTFNLEVNKSSIKKFNKSNPIVLQIGVSKNKNIENTAKALMIFNCHYRIIGKLSIDQIIFLDSLKISYSYVYNLDEKDLIKEYQNSDIVSFISTYEGFGLPIIEAQAMEKPCITSNCSSMPEIAGNAACLVDPFNIENIQNGFKAIIFNDSYRNNLIENGSLNIKRFDRYSISQQYVNLYKNILNKKI
jgi:glycosyltransferase involved in cell wall biosynthesis